jgi:phosphatidylglycerophosphatase A
MHGILRPVWIKTLSSKTVVGLATLFVGERVVAPGTVGSGLGLLWYILFFYGDNFSWFLLKVIVSVYVAIVICGEAELRLKKKDPAGVILDEMVAMPVCFVTSDALQPRFKMWMILLGGFLFFRFFDIVKPLGIKKLQNFNGGIGIVIDDLIAAVYTAISLFIASRLLS